MSNQLRERHDAGGEDLDRDLSELVPDWLLNHSDFCHSRNYGRWENDVGEPHLVACGYKVLRWYSIDEDRFGPLVRAVDVEKNGKTETYFYG